MSDSDSPQSKSMGRRGVLGVLGLAAASGAASAAAGALSRAEGGVPATSRALMKAWVPGAERWSTGEERWISTTCGQCPTGCGVRVRVVEGRAVRIEGNPAHPVNRGGLGPRGLSALQTLYDADRIRGPLAREGSSLAPIEWNDAMRRLVERLGTLRAVGPEKLVVITRRTSGMVHDLWARFCQTFGTQNLVSSSDAGDVLAQAMDRVCGVREPPVFDWTRAACVLSLESGLYEDACPSPHLARVTADLRADPERRGHLVHASPMLDLTAQAADRWLPVEPGSSGALALGLAHVLVRDGLHDAHAAAAIPSFSALATWLHERFSPERTAAETGLSVDAIEALARHLVGRRPSFAYVDARSLEHTNGWHTALAALTLNALLGALGTTVHLASHAPLAEWPEPIVDEAARTGRAVPRLDRAGTPDFPRARSSLRALLPALEASPPSVLILDDVDLLHGEPARERWRNVLERVPFVVCFSSLMDETTDSFAHLVLATHTFLERWEDAQPDASVGFPVVGVRQPAIAPLHDSRDVADVVLDVARALGGTVATSFPWRTFREAFEARARGLFDARRGNIVAPYERDFFRRLYETGFWHDASAEPIRPGRIDLAPAYEPPNWAGDEQGFPLRLVPYRAPGSEGANEPWLRRLRTRPDAPHAATVANVNPESAEGLADGSAVIVTSPFGSIACVLRLDERVTVGCVAVPTGAGHAALGRWARGRGADPTHLISPDPAPTTGAGALATTRVRIERSA